MSSTETYTQFGVRYANGTEDWNTTSWFGHLETAEMRASFEEQYNLRMAQFGMPQMKLTFLTRTQTITVSDSAVIDDTVLPEDTPVTDGEGGAAPDAGPEDPADDAPVGEESPVDTNTPVTKESNVTAG